MTHVDNKMSSRALREEAWHRKVWGDKSCSSKPGAGYKRQSAIVELEAEREEAAGAKKGPCLSLTSGADMEGPGKAPGECGHSHPDKCVPGLLKCPTTRHTHRLFGMPFFFFLISRVDLAVEIQVPWSPKPSICCCSPAESHCPAGHYHHKQCWTIIKRQAGLCQQP